MTGRVHIYCGDGKGKTTAAVGLAIRAAGAGKRVLFTQFFKDGSSSEIRILNQIDDIQVMHKQTVRGFFSRMTPEQREIAARDYTQHFREICALCRDKDVLILDEIISACNHGTIQESELVSFLENRPENLEVVLTGRNPSSELMATADYVTEMGKIKHPFDQGIAARQGIEY